MVQPLPVTQFNPPVVLFLLVPAQLREAEVVALGGDLAKRQHLLQHNNDQTGAAEPGQR